MIDFTFYTHEASTGHTRELLDDISKRYGFIPNLFAYMAEAPTTIEAYLSLNDLVSKTSLSPAQQQVALLAASVENDCEFCTVAHRAMGKMSGANASTLDALNSGSGSGSDSAITDAKDYALAMFTKAIVKQRGRPTEVEIRAFLDAGYSKQQILEVILIVSIKTLSNYVNHLTNPEPNQELLGML